LIEVYSSSLYTSGKYLIYYENKMDKTYEENVEFSLTNLEVEGKIK